MDIIWACVSQSCRPFLNRMDIGAQGWIDDALLWCGIKPPDLPQHCDGLSVGLLIAHALYWKITALWRITITSYVTRHRPDQKGPHIHTCWQLPPHKPRLLRAKREGPARQVNLTQQPTSVDSGLWSEGIPYNMIPMEERYGLYYWCTCYKHRFHLISPGVSGENPPECIIKYIRDWHTFLFILDIQYTVG